MKAKLGYVILALLIVAVGSHLWSKTRPAVVEQISYVRTAPTQDAPSQELFSGQSEESQAANISAADIDLPTAFPDLTHYDDDTLLQMVDHDAAAAMELALRRYIAPPDMWQPFGNNQARDFLVRAIALEPDYADLAIAMMMDFDALPVSAQEAPSWGAQRRLVAALVGERLGLEIDMQAEYAAYREIVPGQGGSSDSETQADHLVWRIAKYRANVTGDRALLAEVERNAERNR